MSPPPPPPSRPRLARASTASALDLRGQRPPLALALAPLSPPIPYAPSPFPQPPTGASRRPLHHRNTLSSAPDGPQAMPALATQHPPAWPKPALARIASIASIPSHPSPQATTTPPISPSDAPPPPFPAFPAQRHFPAQQQPQPQQQQQQQPGPGQRNPTPLHTPPHSQSPPAPQPQGPPRSGPLHPTKFPQHYSLSLYLPQFSPDWITIAQRKGNSLLIVGDNYESDGHYEWQIPFGPDARMDTLRAKFNSEHLEITVARGGPPQPQNGGQGGPMGLGMGMR
ncbi:hypothetical protein CALCODRAFT_511327 [Calocera cornea HHB12733]|uniref:SHSP domain-containing protein n=1 Tax=Calocera cornea HHB12733 TaxID=1353952 RepID=A0A165DTV8_9BASI|nr:hypothetical protein CALCODRAFT_511327 [Calocera cornea HHB12733]